MEYVLIGAELIERPLATVDIEDRGHQFGDGVYEVIRVYNGQLFTAQEHLKRFFKSAANIRITLPFTEEELLDLLTDLVKKNELTLGTIYMQVTRGTAPRNHLFPAADVKPTLIAYTKKVERPVAVMTEGVKAILQDDIRWLRCDIKSLNLLGNLLAKQEANEQGAFEAILHRDQMVTEGSASNVMIVQGGVVRTHPANHLILGGITRQVILELCRVNEIAVNEEPFTVDDLLLADEVFIASTTVEIGPIVEIDGKPIGSGKPGELTRKLQQFFQQEVEKACGALRS